jgi:hypothetical protein
VAFEAVLAKEIKHCRAVHREETERRKMQEEGATYT